MDIDQEKLLIWFGEPRKVQRVLIHLSSHSLDDQELIRFARQTFASGRPPSLDLLLTLPPGMNVDHDKQRFVAMARRELHGLGSRVRTAARSGDPLIELRCAVNQTNADLLIAGLPKQATGAWRSGELSKWMLSHLGPVPSLFLLPAEVPELSDVAA